MPTITLSVPEELKHEMDQSREINWSEVARAAIKTKLGDGISDVFLHGSSMGQAKACLA